MVALQLWLVITQKYLKKLKQHIQDEEESCGKSKERLHAEREKLLANQTCKKPHGKVDRKLGIKNDLHR